MNRFKDLRISPATTIAERHKAWKATPDGRRWVAKQRVLLMALAEAVAEAKARTVSARKDEDPTGSDNVCHGA